MNKATGKAINKVNKFAVIASFFFMGVSATAQADVIDEIEKSFDVQSNANFTLDNVNGSVEIIGWNKEQIQVRAVVKAKNQEDRDRIRVEMSGSSKGVDVETKYEKSGWGSNNGSNGQVKYFVKVPKDTSLDQISLVNGSLVIEDVSGRMDVDLVNGSIKAEGLRNNGKFSSVNGSVKVSYDEVSDKLSAIHLETVNGSIKLHVPSNIDARVNAETMHGSLKSDFSLPVDKGMFTGKSMKGTIGSGATTIELESVNGSVKLMSN